MLKKIEVRGLFGTFNHPIELKKENITLLLGENGLGKTIILKMINSFFDSNFYELQTNMFREFNLTFTDNSVIKIKKTESKEGSQLTIKLMVKSRKTPYSHTINFDEETIRNRRHLRAANNLYFREAAMILQKYLPYPVERIGSDRWMDHSHGIVYSTNEMIERYGKYLPPSLKKQLDTSLPDWLLKKTSSLKTKLIETQRLLTKTKSEESAYHSSVIKYSQELIETIKNKTVAATDLASKLDRSYPNRVVNKITQTTKISDLELEEGLEKLNARRELLNKVGLLDTTEENVIPISNAIKRQSGKNKELLKDVLQIYLDDSNQKLTIYDDLARKINLLIEIINKRFLYKKMSIDKNKGFVFTSTRTGNDIPISGLSSGEQHELVLFFQLLFNTESESLLLIDEPEISLHISWQNQFINDLMEVIQLNNLFALIATHSPDIINNRWELTVQLKGE
jgi:predicted ATP-binding protein involved in virulence